MAMAASRHALAAAAVASAIAATGCVPQRQALIQPACLLLCQADQPVIELGDRTELPPIAPLPRARAK
jgi:hypothetical protein